MRYGFLEIFDVDVLAEACEAFTSYSGMGTAVLDLDGTVHAAAGWQDICTKFHRVNECSAARCRESDTALANRLELGHRFNMYRCKNGLVDAAIPLSIADEHVGNFFIGQFLLSDPDIIFFERQAEQYSFDKASYLDSLKRVPVLEEQKVRETLSYLVELTQLIGRVGLEKQVALDLERAERAKLEKLVYDRTQELEEANKRLEVLNEELKDLADTDPLTGLKNRAALYRHLEVESKRAARGGDPLSLLMIDVDFFKDFNDSYGHLAGDDCLSKVAGLIARVAQRPTDYVARYGGEEFVCLLSGSDLEDATKLAEKLQSAFAAEQIDHEASSVAPFVTVSIGVSSQRPAGDTSPMELLRSADEALYAAKNGGRNCIAQK